MISDDGLNLLRKFEGCRLTAYADSAGVWTIGYGHTRGVHKGDSCTQAQADTWLRDDAKEASDAVQRLVEVPLTQPQTDALTSFVFNLGAGAFEKSTLRKKLNAGDYAGAAAEFGRWVFAGDKKLPGLERRRAAEAELFSGATVMSGPTAPAPDAIPAAPPQTQPRKDFAMPPFLLAALPALIQSIPSLAQLFGAKGEQAEKKVAVVQQVAQIVQDATGAKNIQEAVEAIAADPDTAASVQAAVESRWFEIVEAGGGGIAGAREADIRVVEKLGGFWRSPSFAALALLLPLAYMIVGSVSGLWGYSAWSDDVRAAISTAVVSLIIGGAAGYYWGAATGAGQRKAP